MVNSLDPKKSKPVTINFLHKIIFSGVMFERVELNSRYADNKTAISLHQHGALVTCRDQTHFVPFVNIVSILMEEIKE